MEKQVTRYEINFERRVKMQFGTKGEFYLSTRHNIITKAWAKFPLNES